MRAVALRTRGLANFGRQKRHDHRGRGDERRGLGGCLIVSVLVSSD